MTELLEIKPRREVPGLTILGRGRRVLACCCILLLFSSACRKRIDKSAPPAPESPARPEDTIDQAPEVESLPERIDIPSELVDPDRWLFVEKARDGATGAWATGSFDPKRNKLDIRTRDVAQFALFQERIPIDWKRPVIIGIDGVNAELRKRDRAILHLARDDHGGWVVLEP